MASPGRTNLSLCCTVSRGFPDARRVGDFGAKALSQFAIDHSRLMRINTSAVNRGRGKVPVYGRDVFKEPSAALKGLLKEVEGVRLCSWAQRGRGLTADRAARLR